MGYKNWIGGVSSPKEVTHDFRLLHFSMSWFFMLPPLPFASSKYEDALPLDIISFLSVRHVACAWHLFVFIREAEITSTRKLVLSSPSRRMEENLCRASPIPHCQDSLLCDINHSVSLRFLLQGLFLRDTEDFGPSCLVIEKFLF